MLTRPHLHEFNMFTTILYSYYNIIIKTATIKDTSQVEWNKRLVS